MKYIYRGIGEVTAFAIATIILLFVLFYVVVTLGMTISAIGAPTMKGSINEELTLVRIGNRLIVRNSGGCSTKIVAIIVMRTDISKGSTQLHILSSRSNRCRIDKTVLVPGDRASIECRSTDNELLVPIGVISSRGRVYMYSFFSSGSYVDLLTNDNIPILWHLINGTYNSFRPPNSDVCYYNITDEVTNVDRFEASYIIVLNTSNGLNILASNSTHRLVLYNVSCPVGPAIEVDGETIYPHPGVYLCKNRNCILDISGCSYSSYRMYFVHPLGPHCVSNIYPFTLFGDLDGDGMLELVFATLNSVVDSTSMYSDSVLDTLQAYLNLSSFVIEGPRYSYLDAYIHLYFWSSRGCDSNISVYKPIIELALIDVATGKKIASANITYNELCYYLDSMNDLKSISVKITLSIPQLGFYVLSVGVYDPYLYLKDTYNDVEYILSIERIAVLLHVRT